MDPKTAMQILERVCARLARPAGLGLALSAAAVAGGCNDEGDDAPVGGEIASGGDVYGIPNGGDAYGIPNGGDLYGIPDVPGAMLPSELLLEGDAVQLVSTGSTVDLTVLVLTADGQPAPDVRVDFKMLDDTNTDRSSTGIEGTVLRSTGARTDEAGRATVQVAAGAQETHFKVRAAVRESSLPPVFWQVIVNRPSTASLAVSLQYGGYRQIDQGEVLLYEACDCSTLLSDLEALPPWHDRVSIPYFGPDAQAIFTELPGDATVSALALGQNMDGVSVAAGCASVELAADELNSLIVPLSELPDEPEPPDAGQ